MDVQVRPHGAGAHEKHAHRLLAALPPVVVQHLLLQWEQPSLRLSGTGPTPSTRSLLMSEAELKGRVFL